MSLTFRYKTEQCRTFHQEGFCPYGPRCHFIHETSTPGSPVIPLAVDVFRERSDTLSNSSSGSGLSDGGSPAPLLCDSPASCFSPLGSSLESEGGTPIDSYPPMWSHQGPFIARQIPTPYPMSTPGPGVRGESVFSFPPAPAFQVPVPATFQPPLYLGTPTSPGWSPTYIEHDGSNGPYSQSPPRYAGPVFDDMVFKSACSPGAPFGYVPHENSPLLATPKKGGQSPGQDQLDSLAVGFDLMSVLAEPPPPPARAGETAAKRRLPIFSRLSHGDDE